MTRREQLQDRYEDARFALLMDELGAAEERQAQRESHRLNADGAAGVPEELDRRCRQIIRGARTRRRWRAAGRFTGKAMKRVALAAGIAAILFTTAFALSETVRVNTMNLMVRVFETNTEFAFHGETGNEALQLDVGWVPEEYKLADYRNDEFGIRFYYKASENRTLTITCDETAGMVTSIDTENAEVEWIEVQGERGILSQKETRISLNWSARDNTILVGIMGAGISREDILHIADELRY